MLDLGCGTGNLSSVIADKVSTKGLVIGVDPDEERIAVARRTFGHLKNMKFEEGSSDTLSDYFDKASFDAVFSSNVFHWIHDKKLAMKNIHDMLKPGGRAVMFFETDIPVLVGRAVKELNPEENYRRLQNMLCFEEKETVESYCRDAGLVVIESIEFQQHGVHESLLDFLDAVAASTHGVFDLDFVEEENLRKFKRFVDKEGRLNDEFPACIIVAVKNNILT